MGCCSAYYQRVTRAISSLFRRYGRFVGTHPVSFIIIPIIVFGGLGLGLLALDEESDLEKVYFPMNSRAIKDRQTVRDTFPDLNDVSYHPFSQSDPDNAASLIFKTKAGQSIFDLAVSTEIFAIVSGVENLISSGKTFSQICAMNSGYCVVDGKRALHNDFRSMVNAGVVTYPEWSGSLLDSFLSGVKVTSGNLVSASVLKISFKLAGDAADWKKTFLDHASKLDPNTVEVTYETPESLGEELDKSTKGDIVFFSLTMTICCTYASIVTSGGNPVSTRSMLAFGGILAAGLGIVGSMGLLSVCGVQFVNICGVIPFLIIGIGVDDMFLMMSSWSESLPSKAEEQTVQRVPWILGRTMASAGIGITITSLTDFLAFVIGTTSVFRSVINFSLYAGVAVLFCYLANLTLFSGCLAIHGRRVYSKRHFLTCLHAKSQETLKAEGRSGCHADLCGGSPPRRERDDESICEKFPSRILPHMIKNPAVSIVIILLFLGYLVVSIYGTINLKQGLVLNDLVLDSSYYHKYLSFSDKYFPARIPIGFIVTETVDYSGNDEVVLENLLQQAQKDGGIDSSFQRCWLTSFKNSTSYNAASFMTSLQTFLNANSTFKADVVMDSTKTSIMASRCFVYSEGNSDQYENSRLMQRMRELADDSSLTVFAYHSSFVAFEQFLAVLPATLQLVGCAVAVMAVVTFLFLPHPLMVLLVMLTIVMILTGIFGFLYYWNLTLSSITMIHLVMSVGFSVDFSAHVCTAYLLSEASSRQERARDAIRHAAGPILNGATSTLLGVLLLLASSSFIFQSFFKVMFLVILFGLLHAVFFLPAVLSLLGPQNSQATDDVEKSYSENGVESGGSAGVRKECFGEVQNGGLTEVGKEGPVVVH
ncbi:hypothetical protein ACOMHN_006335 [Nucella lapillus]